MMTGTLLLRGMFPPLQTVSSVPAAQLSLLFPPAPQAESHSPVLGEDLMGLRESSVCLVQSALASDVRSHNSSFRGPPSRKWSWTDIPNASDHCV